MVDFINHPRVEPSCVFGGTPKNTPKDVPRSKPSSDPMLTTISVPSGFTIKVTSVVPINARKNPPIWFTSGGPSSVLSYMPTEDPSMDPIEVPREYPSSKKSDF